MSNILLPWRQVDENFFIRTKYCSNIHYGWLIGYDNALNPAFANHGGYRWIYHAYDLKDESIFKEVGVANSDYTFSKDEAQKIVDEALIKAGWKLIDKDDRILVLL